MFGMLTMELSTPAPLIKDNTKSYTKSSLGGALCLFKPSHVARMAV